MNAAQDDYQWWRSHGYTPASGKPLHLTISDDTTHPIFFDDNIHRMADDSIVAVRARQSPSEQFAALSGEIHIDTILSRGRQNDGAMAVVC
jgi:hypothetical protein